MTNYGIPTCYNTTAGTKINDRANYYSPIKEEILPTKEEILSTRERILPTRKEILSTTVENISTKERILSTKEESISTKEENVSTKEENILTKEYNGNHGSKTRMANYQTNNYATDEEARAATQDGITIKKDTIPLSEIPHSTLGMTKAATTGLTMEKNKGRPQGSPLQRTG
jgi:hypothetical protein